MNVHLRLLLAVSILAALDASGQAGQNSFGLFAEKQDSLFLRAYESRDVHQYEQLMLEFLSRYDSLQPEDQKSYTGYLNGAYYNLACTYSLLGDIRQGVRNFEKAIAAGYMDYAHIQEDSDLDNIRNDSGFVEVNARLREVADYRYILRRAATYNPEDKRPIPTFTYQASNAPELVELRTTLQLDSIAGTGGEVLAILNLLDWIHNLIPHDGNHNNPVVKNAMNMIAQCKREKRGLNCRGLATVLNECYLALGIRSRIVTCLPKDSLKIDQDCHVINAVYASTLKKWLWIDPTFGAYVMDEQGTLLGIAEVRDRLNRNLPLILNPDANWNNRTQQQKEHYLFHYMAKNLYLLECPVNSAYNMETRVTGKQYEYVQLLPLDYYEQRPDIAKREEPDTHTTWITYKTNNQDVFWQEP